MPDWFHLVRSRLGCLGLDPGRECEIVTELADHFEDLSEEGMGGGLSERTVMFRALGDVRDWKQFGHEIRRAELEEVAMNHRTKSVWLPGFLTAVLAWLLYSLLEALSLHPRLVGTAYPPLIFFLPWTLALPVIGAMGAFGSRRGGGNSREMILAGVFPVLPMGALLVLSFPVVLTARLFEGESAYLPLMLSGFASLMLGWIVIPGAALFAGAMLVALAGHHKPMSSHVQA